MTLKITDTMQYTVAQASETHKEVLPDHLCETPVT